MYDFQTIWSGFLRLEHKCDQISKCFMIMNVYCYKKWLENFQESTLLDPAHVCEDEGDMQIVYFSTFFFLTNFNAYDEIWSWLEIFWPFFAFKLLFSNTRNHLESVCVVFVWILERKLNLARRRKKKRK